MPASAPAAPNLTPPREPSEPSEPSEPERAKVDLRYNAWIDGAITLGLGGGVLAWGFLKAGLPNRTCTICDGPGTDVNGFDGFFRDTFKADDIGTPATISHVISYGVSPAAGFAMTIGAAALDGRIKEAPANCLLVIEASLIAVVAKEAFTAAIRRERPQVHALEGEAKRQEIDKQSDPLESFPSGHTASIMAITASSAVISTMRGYRYAPLIWVIGSVIAGGVTYLRVAADQHYMTDNILGAVLGGAIGAAVPLIFHRPIKPLPSDTASATASATTSNEQAFRPMLTTTPIQGGRVVNVGFQF